MNAQPRGQFGTLFRRNDATVQTCRAFGDDHFYARQLFACFYGDAIARSVDLLFRRARSRLRNGADVPAFAPACAMATRTGAAQRRINDNALSAFIADPPDCWTDCWANLCCLCRE